MGRAARRGREALTTPPKIVRTRSEPKLAPVSQAVQVVRKMGERRSLWLKGGHLGFLLYNNYS